MLLQEAKQTNKLTNKVGWWVEANKKERRKGAMNVEVKKLRTVRNKNVTYYERQARGFNGQ